MAWAIGWRLGHAPVILERIPVPLGWRIPSVFVEKASESSQWPVDEPTAIIDCPQKYCDAGTRKVVNRKFKAKDVDSDARMRRVLVPEIQTLCYFLWDRAFNVHEYQQNCMHLILYQRKHSSGITTMQYL